MGINGVFDQQTAGIQYFIVLKEWQFSKLAKNHRRFQGKSYTSHNYNHYVWLRISWPVLTKEVYQVHLYSDKFLYSMLGSLRGSCNLLTFMALSSAFTP